MARSPRCRSKTKKSQHLRSAATRRAGSAASTSPDRCRHSPPSAGVRPASRVDATTGTDIRGADGAWSLRPPAPTAEPGRGCAATRTRDRRARRARACQMSARLFQPSGKRRQFGAPRPGLVGARFLQVGAYLGARTLVPYGHEAVDLAQVRTQELGGGDESEPVDGVLGEQAVPGRRVVRAQQALLFVETRRGRRKAGAFGQFGDKQHGHTGESGSSSRLEGQARSWPSTRTARSGRGAGRATAARGRTSPRSATAYADWAVPSSTGCVQSSTPRASRTDTDRQLIGSHGTGRCAGHA
ncbi:hypothetical protein FHX42_002127 [Saccharopolyspora lacisalsi]|uniref:Uncharacterized protein n=1 Tax=Halosaccharopolyspora lacisalsi TaxID=1000566 RepID=A0A839DV39_9PSEU|nr:hypothetical protein [Halosaccharopolyspora lacisalsi]